MLIDRFSVSRDYRYDRADAYTGRAKKPVDFLQHMTDTFHKLSYYLNIQRHYPGCNSSFVSLIGKDLEDIAGKTKDKTGGSWKLTFSTSIPLIFSNIPV